MSTTNSNDQEEKDWDFNEYTDQKWKEQQRKTFTNWINSHLRKCSTQIEDIFDELKDGRKLIKLLEMLSKDKIPTPDKGKMRLHMIANVNKALRFIASKGVKLVSIGAEEIVDGNHKLTLGMIWTVILRFAIEDITVGDVTAKAGLLLWCQRRAEPYKNVKINNFTTSFKDGMAFLALLHSQDKSKFEYEKYKKGNDLVNLEDAFKIAEEEYDIMQMMDPAEIVDLPTPDEHSVMAYVSSYYHAFSGAEKAKNAANRISKAIVKNMENERDMEDYDKIASALNEWIDIKTKELDDRPGVNDSAMLDKMFNEFREYRSNEKPPKLEEKSKLNTTFETLQTRLRLNGRSPFVPETDKLIEDINNNWKNLELAEKNHEAWLLLTKKIRDRSNFLKQKFERKATIQEQWSEGKIDAMDDSNIMNASLSELKTMIRKQDAFESELQAQEPRIRQLYLIIVELRSMEYGDFENLEFRWEEISKVWEAIQKKSGAFMHSLKERSTHLDEIDVLKLEFAKKVVLFYNWMTSSIEDLEDKFQVMTVSEMELIIRDHEEFKNVFSTSIEKLEDIKETANNTNILADKYNVTVGENEYTTLKLQDIVEKYDELEPAIKVRDEELNEAKTIQIENEKLRFQFATLAKQVNDKVNECANQISALGYNENGTSLEDQINDFSKIEETLNGFEPEMSKLADLSNNLIDAGVFDNQHTTLTIGSVLINWHQQKNNISRTINEINNQILMRDTKGLKEEEIQEYRRSFLHFDKNKTKALDSDEFKSCLISLGRLDVNDDTDKNYANILADVDPKSTGSVSFSSFMNFMSKERGEANTADQIINSFKIIAGDKPYITADIIKRELPPDQAEYCIVKMLPYEGTDGPEDAYDYNSFSSALYNEASF